MTKSKLLLKHSDFGPNLKFQAHRMAGHFVDVTLSCVSKFLKCHQLILSSCSYYFREILVNNPSQNPIIFLRNVDFDELKLLVDFMYTGEIQVQEDKVSSILRLASDLKVVGLCNDAICKSVTDNLMKRKESGGNTETINIEKVNEVSEKKSKKRKTSTSSADEKEQLKKSEESDVEVLGEGSEVGENDRVIHIKSEEIDIEDDASQEEYSTWALNNVECRITDPDDPPLLDEGSNSTLSCKQEAGFEGEAREDEKDDLKLGTYQPVNIRIKSAVSLLESSSSGLLADNSTLDSQPRARDTRARRPEQELMKAAEMVRVGKTFQMASDTYGIPISTIRFYMARRGILPVRRRGRVSERAPSDDDIHPPFEIVHYRLPDIDKPS